MVDLDEILAQVRDAEAKDQLREAISCYRAGAYRSAIVSTWIAVVFDYVAKLRELEMTGNQSAKQKLKALEQARKNHDLPQLLNFEKSLVEDAATTFELISPVECADLERVYEDRNRCAHPSLTALDESFHPSSELARAHIVAVVRNMLSQAPIQGTAAATRVLGEIFSEFFPVEPKEVAEYLRHGPLGRAKDTLIRSVILGITKDLMTEDRPNTDRKKQYATLNAVGLINHPKFTEVIQSNLERIIEKVDEDKTSRIVSYVGQVEGTWKHIGPAAQVKCKSFVENASAQLIGTSLIFALDNTDLQTLALKRINDLDSSLLARMLQVRIDPLLKEHCVVLTEKSGSFREAEANLRSLILPFAKSLTGSEFRRVAEAFQMNYQIRQANDAVPILNELFRQGVSAESHRDGWVIAHKVLCKDYSDHTLGVHLATDVASRYGLTSSAVQSINDYDAIEIGNSKL